MRDERDRARSRARNLDPATLCSRSRAHSRRMTKVRVMASCVMLRGNAYPDWAIAD
jgi:hypothetical protein